MYGSDWAASLAEYRPGDSMTHLERKSMGRGDQRTRKGKIYAHSYGKRRPRRRAKASKGTA